MEKRKVYINKKIDYCGRDCPYYIIATSSPLLIFCCNSAGKVIDSPADFPEWCPLEKVQ